MESALKAKIIGQDDAVERVARAIKRTRADLSGRRRPASFIFVGPTGVGKTELVKQLAGQLFDTPDPLIRLDMSEFMEKHAVSRLDRFASGLCGLRRGGPADRKGAPPPYSVVLFDEIEKAHPDVMNILLQILDEGRINDAQGRAVSFENTVICMTSNAGSTDRVGETGFNKTAAQMSESKTLKALGEFLRPEFLGRVDEVVVFRPLEGETPAEDRRPDAGRVQTRPGQQGRGIQLYPRRSGRAGGGGFRRKYGARDLRRTIRPPGGGSLAERLLQGTLGTAVTLDAEDGKPVLR